MLHEVELGSTFGNMLLQLATLKFVARQVAYGVVIRATKLCNLQSNNVARQVARKCCLYYLAFILKKQKILYLSFNLFSYTVQIGSNWYMDTDVRDLEVAFF